MIFHSVVSAHQNPKNPTFLDLVILVDPEDGTGVQEWPFTYDPADKEGLTPEIENFFVENPDFAVTEADPVPDPAPGDFPLTARQLRLGLVRNNIPLATVQAAIDAMPSPQRDEAQIYWEFSTEIHWEHPMTGALMQLIGLDPADAEVMWMAAKDYER